MLKKLFFVFLVATIAIFSKTNDNSLPIKIYKDSPSTRKLGFGEWDIYKDGEALIIKTFIKQEQVVIDAGAHVGEWSECVLHTTDNNCRLYAFEPVPDFFNKLEQRLNAKAECLNFALGKYKGTTSMNYYYEESQGCSSLFERPVLNHVRARKIPISVISLDDFCTKNRINHIHFLKIDTEGSELAVLQGAHKLISKMSIDFIQFEYGGTFPDANITLFEIYHYLTSNNYKIYRIAPDGLIEIPQWNDYLENSHLSNYLAIKTSRTHKES